MTPPKTSYFDIQEEFSSLTQGRKQNCLTPSDLPQAEPLHFPGRFGGPFMYSKIPFFCFFFKPFKPFKAIKKATQMSDLYLPMYLQHQMN